MHIIIAVLILLLVLSLIHVFGPGGGLKAWRTRKALRREAVTSLKQTEAAITRYEEQLCTDPNRIEAIHRLGEAYWQKAVATEQLADWRFAEAFLHRAVAVGQPDARRLFGLGTCQWLLGHKNEAISSLRAANELDPDNLEIHGQLGKMLFRSGNWRAFMLSVQQGMRRTYQEEVQRRH